MINCLRGLLLAVLCCFIPLARTSLPQENLVLDADSFFKHHTTAHATLVQALAADSTDLLTAADFYFTSLQPYIIQLASLDDSIKKRIISVALDSVVSLMPASPGSTITIQASSQLAIAILKFILRAFDVGFLVRGQHASLQVVCNTLPVFIPCLTEFFKSLELMLMLLLDASSSSIKLHRCIFSQLDLCMKSLTSDPVSITDDSKSLLRILINSQILLIHRMETVDDIVVDFFLTDFLKYSSCCGKFRTPSTPKQFFDAAMIVIAFQSKPVRVKFLTSAIRILHYCYTTAQLVPFSIYFSIMLGSENCTRAYENEKDKYMELLGFLSKNHRQELVDNFDNIRYDCLKTMVRQFDNLGADVMIKLVLDGSIERFSQTFAFVDDSDYVIGMAFLAKLLDCYQQGKLSQRCITGFNAAFPQLGKLMVQRCRVHEHADNAISILDMINSLPFLDDKHKHFFGSQIFVHLKNVLTKSTWDTVPQGVKFLDLRRVMSYIPGKTIGEIFLSANDAEAIRGLIVLVLANGINLSPKMLASLPWTKAWIQFLQPHISPCVWQNALYLKFRVEPVEFQSSLGFCKPLKLMSAALASLAK